MSIKHFKSITTNSILFLVLTLGYI